MLLLLASFLAGVLTSLAPCILPVLPVIVGSSVLSDGDKKQDRRKPYIIVASLGVSVVLFTVLLKVSSALIGIDPQIWTLAAGGIVIALGVSLLFPRLWAKISLLTGLEHRSNSMLGKAGQKSGTAGAILTGAALGPVFSSCSPVYALVLATVLPVNLALGMVYIVSYALGLSLSLLAIALIGQRLTARLGWAVDPESWFRKVLAIILILVGLMVVTGYDKQIQTWAADHLPFSTSSLEESLVNLTDDSDNDNKSNGDNDVFNVTPYDAPELVGTGQWFNSEPLALKDLKGQVVLIDFWTYSCINCLRTLPYLQQWYETYQDEGLVIIGVHAPEFAFEKVADNVANFVDKNGLTYPIVQDNDFATWQAYNNRFWPAHYLIDKDGQVRREHFGEGKYEETEAAIRQLLADSGNATTDAPTINGSTEPPISGQQTPETYLGYTRGERLANSGQFAADETVDYTLASNLGEHQWSLGGPWQIGAESSLSMADNSQLRFSFSAKEVYLVMDGPAGSKVDVAVDGLANPGGGDVQQGKVTLDGARLYRLVNADSFLNNRQLTLTFPKGVTVNAFTFGS